MGKPEKKKGKGGTILLVLLLLVVGVVAAGYFKPDLPVIGPLVAGFFKKGAEGVDQSGVYKVKVMKVALDPQEFKDGEKIDLQVYVKRVDAEGKEHKVWDSEQWGERIGTVGQVELTAQWSDRPFECTWQPGDKLVVEVWDRRGGDTKVAEWTSDPEGKEFPLKGVRTVSPFKGGKTVESRKGATNQVVFEAERIGDYPAAQ